MDGSRSFVTSVGTFNYNIHGMDAIHTGVELDFDYRPFKCLDIEGVVSFGDWMYNSSEKAYIYDEGDVLRDSINFSAKGVHVGDAAQTQYGLSVRYEPIRGLYIKPRFTYFGKNYSKFDPFSLEYRKFGSEVKDFRGKESWQMPDYYTFDLSGGYEYGFNGVRLNFNVTITNLLDVKYITDGTNNGIYGSSGPPIAGNQGFDAQSATVYFGQGRKWVAGIKLTF